MFEPAPHACPGEPAIRTRSTRQKKLRKAWTSPLRPHDRGFAQRRKSEVRGRAAGLAEPWRAVVPVVNVATLRRSARSNLQLARGAAIFSGDTPARTAMVAHTFGTYIRVSDGSEAAISAKVAAFFCFNNRRTRPSPALYAARASGQSPNFPYSIRKYRAAASADFFTSIRSSGRKTLRPRLFAVSGMN